MSQAASKPRLPLVDLGRQHASLRIEFDEAIARVFASSAFILGAETRAFEEEFAAFCGAPYAIGCGNGTDALELALWALGVRPGDEVITVAYTFAATAEAICRSGATPIFVDVVPDTLLMDLNQVETAITERTRVILPVHLYGSCVDMAAVMAIARRNGLKVIEDAAQAHGAVTGGKRAGTIGDIGCFSFYPGKNLGACGDAGAIVTSDAHLEHRMRQARDHGRSGKYEHEFVGRNSRMDGIQAAILRLKLTHLENWNRRRRELADRYRFLLKEVLDVRVVAVPVDGEPVFHLFVVECDERDRVKDLLSSYGIEAGVHYPIPLNLQLAFAGAAAVCQRLLPVGENAAARVLSLPLFPEMENGEVDRVVGGLEAALRAVRSTDRQLEGSL